MDKTTPIELAREVQRLQEEGLHPTKACAQATKKLALAVIYEGDALNKAKNYMVQLSETINKQAKELQQARQEQKEKDAGIVMENHVTFRSCDSYGGGYIMAMLRSTAKAIREQE